MHENVRLQWGVWTVMMVVHYCEYTESNVTFPLPGSTCTLCCLAIVRILTN